MLRREITPTAEDCMTDATTDAAPETKALLRWAMPVNTEEVLQLVLVHGNTLIDDGGEHLVAGTPAKPGAVLPCSGNDILTMAMNGLLTGERGLMMTTRRGRHFARHGSLETFDDRLMDYDLAAWGRGDIDYQIDELTEAVEGYCHELVLTRGEAMIVLLKKGVITVAEARTDV
jgi:hypothetical protein